MTAAPPPVAPLELERALLAPWQAACAALPTQRLLYLHGERDGCLAVATARSAQRAIEASGNRFEVLDGLGHFLHLEAPDAVNDRIIDFLPD